MPPRYDYNEGQMQSALEAVRNGSTAVKAAGNHGVPRSSLGRRQRGATTMQDAKQPYQRLTPDQEDDVDNFINQIYLELGHRPTYEQIREFATGILIENGGSGQLGKNWVFRFMKRHPKLKDMPCRPNRLFYQNQSSLQWNKALYLQHNLFEWAKSDPKWTSAARFDFPGAVRTYQTFKCAIKHFTRARTLKITSFERTTESMYGGCFLNKAFQTILVELTEGDLNVIQDICLNIFGTLVRYDLWEVGTKMLWYCSAFLKEKSGNKLPSDSFAALARIMGPDKHETNYYLGRLTGLYASTLEQMAGSSHRRTTQAQRRHLLIVRDFETTASADEVNSIITSYEGLLISAIQELGRTHDQTLRIENEVLTLQNYIRRYQDDYIARVDASMFQVTRLYAAEQRFERWDPSHQAAILRFLERKYDYYKDFKEVDHAVEAAACILRWEGYKTERWIQFSLDFEFWLQGLDPCPTQVCEFYRQQRVNSRYYRQLYGEFAG
ncbi:hypothetical protein NM208_g5760 [Fusarium decemcellulare]|uniref:Uncharacterized protein n=1 Tax=Fusarium decemcellulare TaxID=57161 RepID=A0ACC1SFP5_9HYPO|nr:hypothetical protein NM208_g5760 [Fusarium decemcellulare]